MKLIRSGIAFFAFLVILLLTYYLHITFFNINVVFYAAITDAVTATIFSSVILFLANYFRLFNWFEKTQLIIIYLLAGYAFAISVPTVIDRSLSFYILEKLQQRGGGIQLNSFEQVFTQEYIMEHRLVDVRLTEQVESGTIQIKDGCVMLTDKGKNIASFSQMFRRNFLPKHRLLMGEYSDDLTHPFKNSLSSMNYLCH
jgi:hypothetical protein